MRYYCTLFDKNYLYKGLSLYRSLADNGEKFTLWVLCLDDTTREVLEKLAYPGIKTITLAEFEDEGLKKAKKNRNLVEYYWTCTPSLLLYVMKKENLPELTYLDSDVFFFSGPQPVFDEIGNASVSIIGHRYSPEYEHYQKYGIYNVEWLTFRNDGEGMRCIEWWRERCLEWCYSRFENGKYGDQLYLNDWPERFRNVRVIAHKGAGVAPWNVKQYRIEERRGRVLIDEAELIFYHFHEFQLLEPGKFEYYGEGYRLQEDARRLIYRPYEKSIQRSIAAVKRDFPYFDSGYKRALPKRREDRSYLMKLAVTVKGHLKRMAGVKNG
ncbi:MAG TPA: glycosyl transferase [Candidatus Omnitrophota bacterium]|nr:glycosyl transferase [Candidatus Omnitrophota bacterium]